MRRSALTPYFTRPSVMALEPFIRARVELLCESLIQQSKEGPVEIYTLFLAFANDIIGDYAFDYSMHLLKNPQRAADWRTTIDGIASLTPLIKQFPWLIAVARRVPSLLLQAITPRLARSLALQEVSLGSIDAARSFE